MVRTVVSRSKRSSALIWSPLAESIPTRAAARFASSSADAKSRWMSFQSADFSAISEDPIAKGAGEEPLRNDIGSEAGHAQHDVDFGGDFGVLIRRHLEDRDVQVRAFVESSFDERSEHQQAPAGSSDDRVGGPQCAQRRLSPFGDPPGAKLAVCGIGARHRTLPRRIGHATADCERYSPAPSSRAWM